MSIFLHSKGKQVVTKHPNNVPFIVWKMASNTCILEAENDRLVYGLYGLTEEEIKIVEGKDNKWEEKTILK